MEEPVKPVAVWKRVTAAIFDFVTVFFVFGWVIGKLTGNTTESGFKLQGRAGHRAVHFDGGLFLHRPPLCRRHAVGPHLPHRSAAAELKWVDGP
jgi:hypothetical protein